MAEGFFMVTIKILEEDGSPNQFNVELPGVPRIGEIIHVTGEVKEGEIDQVTADFIEKNSGKRSLIVRSVEWGVTRQLGKISHIDHHRFGYVEVSCRDAE